MMDSMDEKNRHLHNLFKSTEVEKRFLDAIKENIDYIKASEAVDLGAGGGRFALVLSRYVKTLYCVDVSDEAIEFMKLNLAGLENTKIIKVQADRLPFLSVTIVPRYECTIRLGIFLRVFHC